ncbi:MAG: hypothetical protein M0P71_01230 [Melioribacteraceae bacterium]|nr:hypothetical protein [Melioribacteraceae bacterium]
MKKCGCKEKCFKRGEQWGHLEGVMCKHLGEDSSGGVCLKDLSRINVYINKLEYEKITKDNK